MRRSGPRRHSWPAINAVMSVAGLLAGLFPCATEARQNPSPCGPALKCEALNPDHFLWTKDLAGGSTHDATLAGHFSALIADVAPDAVYHFGLDMPVAAALRGILRGLPDPITVRANRFVMLSACSPTCTNGRAFLWIDTQQGVAIAGIDFAPTNGEPTPTLTLISKQVLEPVTKRVQLPPDFVEDLATWTRASRHRGVAARYFMNGSGLKTVVPHDEDNCHGADRSALAATLCGAMNGDAADQDLAAAYYLLTNDFKPDSPMRAALTTDEDKWVAERRTTCGPGTDGPALACRLKLTTERVAALTDLHLKANQ